MPWVLTLLAVHIAWVFFRCQPILLSDTLAPESTAAALARAGYFVKHLFVPVSVDAAIWLPNKAPMLALLALMFAMQLYSEWTRRGRPRPVLPAPLAGLGYAAWIVVSPDAGHEVGGAGAGTEPVRDALQHGVTGGVPEPIVDGLEAIEVEKDESGA